MITEFSVGELKSVMGNGGGFAKSNKFAIKLPLGESGMERDIEVLCKASNLPGKQILSVDRRVGLSHEKVAYGYAHDDVTLTFNLTEDHWVKSYFEGWQMGAVAHGHADVHYPKYRNEYTRSVHIFQLSQSDRRHPIAGSPDEYGDPATIHGRGNQRVGGPAAIGVHAPMTKKRPGIELINAYPTTITPVQFNDANGEPVELSVQLSYKRWINK